MRGQPGESFRRIPPRARSEEGEHPSSAATTASTANTGWTLLHQCYLRPWARVQLTRNRAAAFQSRPRTALEANSEPNWLRGMKPARVRGGQGDVPGGASCLVSLTSRRPAVPGPSDCREIPWPRSRPLRKVDHAQLRGAPPDLGLSLRNHSVLDVTRYAWSPALTWSMARAIAHRSSSTENGFLAEGRPRSRAKQLIHCGLQVTMRFRHD